MSVIAPGHAPATLHDCATAAAADVSNQVGTVPAAVGTYQINFPCATGVVVVPGAGQVLAVSFQ